MANSIPTAALSPFFTEGDQDGKKKAVEVISQAFSQYGFFKIVKRGIPPELLNRALELSKTCFSYSDEEKLKSCPGSDALVPAGYNRQPHPKEVLEDTFSHLAKTGMLIECILNDCLGLPPNFLKECYRDRSWDFMTALHYLPSTETENNGTREHEDGNCITFVFQDDA